MELTMDYGDLPSYLKIEMKKDFLHLDAIVVTGTRTPHTLKMTPVLTQLITASEITSQGSSTIRDVLEMELPSVEMGRHGFGTSMSMQGLESTYTLVLIDGERMAGESGGNVDFSRINVANIEQVEIIRGASSALYGSNAMGGVINIITKKPQKRWDVSIGSQFTQFNQINNTQSFIDSQTEDYLKTFYRRQDLANLNADISVGYRNNDFYTNTYLGFKSADAYRLFNKEGHNRRYLHNDSVAIFPVSEFPTLIKGFSDHTISNKTGFALMPNLKAELRANYYSHEEADADVKTNSVHNRYKNYTFGGFLDFSPASGSAFRLSHNFDTYDKYDVMERLNNENRLNYRNIFHNTRFTYNFNWKKHAILLGAENFYESLNNDMFVYDTMVEKLANDMVLVMQDEYQATKSLMIVAGLRAGYHSAFKTHASPSLTMRLNQNRMNYRLSYARGYRSPSLKELYMNWDHQGMFTIVGSDNLKPETNDYFSFSVDYLNPESRLNATAITSYNKIYDKIDGVWMNNQTEFHYINFEDMQVLSNELMLKWRILPSLGFRGGYAHTRVMMNDDAINRSSLSPHAFTLQFDYRYSIRKYTLGAKLGGKVTGKKEFNVFDSNIDQYYEVSYPTFSVWNLTLNHTFANRIMVDTGIKNLFNHQAPIVTFNTSASPGRQFFVALKYNL
jgi:outer membrane receptor for ferrienterochelin and colicins